MEQLLALLSLVLTSLIVMGSPGPATMSVTAVGAAFGFRRALPYLAGIVLGTCTVLLAVAAGLLAMLAALPGLTPILRGASFAYIAFLAWKIAMAPPLSQPDRASSAPGFAGGVLLSIANPKAYFAIAAVFADRSVPASSPLIEAMLTLAVLTFMIILIHLGWLGAGVALSRLLQHPVRARIVNLLFAALLIGSSILAISRG
jgi:threonine/homoserine/homoserine lactone efflux protein